MMKFLLGPTLVGVGYVTGSMYGADVEQVVHKRPSETYAGFERAIDNVRPSGMTFFDGGNPLAYELKVERDLDRHLHVTLYFEGKPGAQADLIFAPSADGKGTLVTARLDGERAVLRSALAGTSKARLAYAPDWMLNLTARPLLRQVADQIEQGAPADLGLTPGEMQAQWEANLSEEQRAEVAEWRQYDATRPAVDPAAAARSPSN
jgi:hypothetical protein